MEKKRLVDFVAKIMEKSGFNVHKNYKTSKYLVDIYGVQPTIFGDIGVVVACKNYEERWKVGLDVLKEMEMVAKTLQASKVVVISTSEFSDNAISYADRRNIKLIDKDGLMNLAKSFSSKNVETNENIDDYAEDGGDEDDYVPSKNIGSSFMSKGRKASLSGKKRSESSDTFETWVKTVLSSSVGLIIIVLAVSYVISMYLNLNNQLLGILRILLAAILSYGIVIALERDLMVTLIKGSTVFFVTLIIYIALIFIT